MDADTAGTRLERAIRIALSGKKGLSMAALCKQANVSRQTLYQWFTDKQDPTARSMTRIANVLEVPVSSLWDAWEGREAIPTSTEAALLQLVGRMDRQAAQTDQLLRLIRRGASDAITEGVRRALEEGVPEPIDTPPPGRPRRTDPPES